MGTEFRSGDFLGYGGPEPARGVRDHPGERGLKIDAATKEHDRKVARARIEFARQIEKISETYAKVFALDANAAAKGAALIRAETANLAMVRAILQTYVDWAKSAAPLLKGADRARTETAVAQSERLLRQI